MTQPSPNPQYEKFAALWLGDGVSTEFAPTFDELARRTALSVSAGWSEPELPTADLAPALIVVAQAFAGELAEGDVLRLRRRYPTAALLRIVGSWCEGELRTLPPPAAVRRCCWHHAHALVRADLDRLEARERPDWGLPATATDDEGLLTTVRTPPAKRIAQVRIGIAAADPFVERWLVDFCARYQHLQPTARNAQPEVILWDAPHTPAAQERECRQLAREFATAKIIALANYPRRDDAVRVRDWGVADVVGKPMSSACLLASIGRFA